MNDSRVARPGGAADISTDGARERHSRGGLLVSALLLCAAIALNQSAIHWRENATDDHLFAWHAWCVAQGARPYLDIWDNKPPGIWWAGAAAMSALGDGVGSSVVLCALALVLALSALVGAAVALYGPALRVPAALLACGLALDARFELGGFRTETFVVACEATAVWAYLRWLSVRRGGWLIVAGLAAGAAPWFKQSGVAAGIACGLHFCLVSMKARRTGGAAVAPGGGAPGGRFLVVRAAALWLLAALVPSVVAFALLARDGAVGEALFALGRFNRAYFAVNDATWIHLDRAWAAYGPALRPWLPIFALAALGPIGGALRAWGDRARRAARSAAARPSLLAWLWFLLAAYLACVGPGRRGHHFLPALPPLLLLALHPLALLLRGRRWRECLTARPIGVACVVGYAYLVVLAIGGGWAELRRGWVAKGGVWTLRRETPTDYERQAARIRELTGARDTIYVFGWSPGTYRFAFRRCPSRFATFEKLGQVGGYADFIYRGAIDDIRRAPAALIAITPNDRARMEAPDSRDAPAGDFIAWIADRYQLVETVGGMELWLRRSEPQAPARGD